MPTEPVRTCLPTLTALAISVALVAVAPAAHAQGLERPVNAEIVGHITAPAPLEATDALVNSLRYPPGFRLTKWAENLDTPRVIVVAPGGDVYVSSRVAGTITLLRGGERATHRQTVLSGRKDVHGLAIANGRLYYAIATETFSAPIRADGSLGAEQRIAADLPDTGQHNNRTLAFGPDGWLYESIGSTCNECDEQNPESATMLRMRPDGSGREIFATGLRNTIGFMFRPGTDELWGWDDGTDWLGDDEQREELNLIRPGRKYGWPYVFGNGVLNLYRDPPRGQGTVEQWDRDSERPVISHTAHSSGMQIAFYDGKRFPRRFHGDLFVTLHGSWNREPPSGYEVLRVQFQAGRPVHIQPFLTGFLIRTGEKSWARFGRPMGLAVAADGSLLVGDDQNGIIYRIDHPPRPAGARAEGEE
ncbi:PQQ-dependent sugar dehydrogenase [Derxia gummosa]|uniref:PQQ-dependent sugar dehydrogenase n=1 Tax=Derxia gummosa DSM 723 TaxID=1121388 RepID=A0A8B6X8I3_9BURK|nr:PQQ-dependent sugar dehydrogenase [Derxia gummosa]